MKELVDIVVQIAIYFGHDIMFLFVNQISLSVLNKRFKQGFAFLILQPEEIFTNLFQLYEVGSFGRLPSQHNEDQGLESIRVTISQINRSF